MVVVVVVVGEGGREDDELVGTRAAERDGNCTTKKICQTGGKYIEKGERERCGRLSAVRAERATGFQNVPVCMFVSLRPVQTLRRSCRCC